MQPTTRGLDVAMSFRDGRGNPIGSKFDARKARRAALSPHWEHGLVSALGPYGLFYFTARGASGVGPNGQNWDRLAIAVRRLELPLVGDKKIPYFCFLTAL